MFFVNNTLLSPYASIGSFQHTTQIVITLDNQKNAIRGETASNFRSDSSEACTVQASVNNFLQLQE